MTELRDDFANTQPLEAVDVHVLDNDTDVTTEALDVVGDPENGSVSSLGDGVIRYVPGANFQGTDVFTYSDGTQTAEVFVNVWPSTNESPIARDDRITVYGSETQRIFPIRNDEDPDAGGFPPVSLSNVGEPDNGRVDPNFAPSRAFTYTADRAFTGEDSFSYTIRDQDGARASATVSVEVLPGATEDWALHDLSGEDQITALYIGLLGRAPDGSGLDFWTQQFADLRSEGVPARDTLGEIAFGIYLSDESRTLHPGVQPGQSEFEAFNDLAGDIIENGFNRTSIDPSTIDDFGTSIREAIEIGASAGVAVVDGMSATANDRVGAAQVDIDALRNKIAVAQAYTEAVPGDAFDRQESKEVISTVGADTESLENALGQIDGLA